MMFLCTVINPENGKLIRKVFRSLSEAEGYCDWCERCRISIFELEHVDTSLSDMLETCWG